MMQNLIKIKWYVKISSIIYSISVKLENIIEYNFAIYTFSLTAYLLTWYLLVINLINYYNIGTWIGMTAYCLLGYWANIIKTHTIWIKHH